MKTTLKLKHDTFLRTFGPSETEKLQLNMKGSVPDHIHYVQPIDGILKDYDEVEVTSTEIVGKGDWGRINIEVITTYSVEKYDDLSVQLVPNKVMVPGTERTQNPPR